MDEVTVALIVGAFLIFALGLLWSWTNTVTVTRQTGAELTISTQRTNADTAIAKMQLEGKQIEVTASQAIALANNQVQAQKHQLDHEIKSEEILLKRREQDTRLDEQKVIQNGLTSRHELECQTKTNLSQLEIGFKTRKLNSQAEIFEKSLEYGSRGQQAMLDFKSKELDFLHADLKSRSKTSKYLADRSFETQSLMEKHKDGRWNSQISASLEMDRSAKKLRREENSNTLELGRLELSATREMFMAKMDSDRKAEVEKTRRKAIEAEGAVVRSLIKTGVNIGATAVMPGGPLGKLAFNAVTSAAASSPPPALTPD